MKVRLLMADSDYNQDLAGKSFLRKEQEILAVFSRLIKHIPGNMT